MLTYQTSNSYEEYVTTPKDINNGQSTVSVMVDGHDREENQEVTISNTAAMTKVSDYVPKGALPPSEEVLVADFASCA